MALQFWAMIQDDVEDVLDCYFRACSISVNCIYQGADAGTIYGTYYVTGDHIHCEMTSNGQPYIVDYQFILDGRELTLQDDDGPAHYLKVS